MAGYGVQVGPAHEAFQGGEEAVGNVDAFPGYLVADRDAGQVCDGVQAARFQRGDPLDKDSAVGREAVIYQLFPLPVDWWFKDFRKS